MAKDLNDNPGVRLLVEYYRSEFRTPENLNHYLPEDLKVAERTFIKFKLSGQLGNLLEEV
jgi:hypothetical protein